MPTRRVVVGAGHCGLAMSRCLAARSIDHVVLERGEVANSWRTQRWDSLRLLTPNWMTRLPGFAYRGDDPDGYLDRARGGRGCSTDYAEASAAPVLTGTTVTVGPARPASGYLVRTDRGTWHARDGRGRDRRDRGRRSCPAGCRGARRDHHGHRRGLPQPRPAARRRRAGRRRLGERGPDRRRAAPLRAAGHAGRRRARADAADLPGPRHPVVDGRVGPARRALRRRSRTWCGRATCRRCSWSARRARDARPQRAAPARGAAGRPARRHPGRRRRSSPGRCPTCARWPTSSWAGCWTPSTPGPTGPGVDAEPPQRFAPTEVPGPARCRRALGAAGSRRSSGRPATGRTCPCSTSPVFDRKGRVVHDGGVTAAPGPVPDRPAVPAPPQVDA